MYILGFVSNISFFFIYFFWLHRASCGILVPQLGIEPTPPTVEVRSLNHWDAREVSIMYILKINLQNSCELGNNVL